MSMETKRDDVVSAETSDRLEVLSRLKRAGLYTGSGFNSEQRKWIKERDGYQCQFFEFKHDRGSDKWSWVQCERKEDPSLAPDELKKVRGRQRWQLEVHHIYPQSKMAIKPVKYGGEQPINGIVMCAGAAGNWGHHDLMSPIMIVSKVMYPSDHTSYEQWLGHIREAEQKGMEVHNFDWDGMLKMVAKRRTMQFLRETNKQFPYVKENR